MSDLFSRGSRAKLEQMRRSVAVLPSWMRRLGYYGLALLFVAAAVILRWELRDVLSATPTLVFYLAWVGAAAFGGLGPGLLATAASWLCIDFLFDPTIGQISFADPTSIDRLLILMAGGLIVSVVGEKMRRTRIRERRQMHELADLTQLTSLGQLLIRDNQDRIVFWSDGCARLYGFTAEQAVGRVSHELLRTEFPQPLETIRATLHKTGRWEGEQTHRRADGSVVHVASLWVLRDGTANPVVLEVNNDITGRKHAEAALREARNGLEIRVQERTAQLRKAKELVESERQRFQNVLDQLPAYLVLLSPDYHVSFANRLFEERFGKCEGRRCYEYLFHRTEPCENCEAYKVLNTNAPRHWEWIGPDGRDYDIYDFPFTDVDGSPLIMEVGLDITERKRAEAELAKHREHLEELVQERTSQLETANEELREREQALRESEEKYRRIVETATEGIAMADADARIVFANDRWSEIFGYRLEEDGPVTLFDLVFPEDAAQMTARWESRQRGRKESYESRFRRKDGRPIWALIGVAPRLDSEGRFLGTLVMATDITERKRAEEGLRQSERLFKSTFENAAIGIAHVALDGYIRQFNSRFCEIAGYSCDEIVGKTCEQITLAGDWEAEKEPLRRLLDGEVNHYSIEKRYIRVDGSPVWVNLTRSIQHDDAGNPEYFIILVEDISERKTGGRGAARKRATLPKTLRGEPRRSVSHQAGRNDSRFQRRDDADAGIRFAGGTLPASIVGFLSPTRSSASCSCTCCKETAFVPAKEAVLRRKDGSVLYALGSAVLLVNEQTGEPYIQGVAIDITERTQAEEALRRNEEQFHRLFEDDLTGDYISTPEGRILLCNPAFAEMFGFSSTQDAVGTSILDLYTDPGEREPLLARLKREGKIGRFGVWRKRRDGEPIHIVENLVGHFNDQGELYEIKGYLFEDTERKRAEEALRELTATLESKVAQRTAELKHRARQLQKLTLDMSETEDRERKRMAEILHDDLQQQLAAAKFHLGLMRSRAGHDASLMAIAAQVDHMLVEAIRKSRSLSHELSPAVMHHADFAETLRWLANQVHAKHGLVVRVHAHGEIHSQSDALKSLPLQSGPGVAVQHCQARAGR